MLYSDVRLVIFGKEVEYVSLDYSATRLDIILEQDNARLHKLTDILHHEDLPVQVLVINPRAAAPEDIKDYIVQFDGFIPKASINSSHLSSSSLIRLYATATLKQTLSSIKYNYISSGSLFAGTQASMLEKARTRAVVASSTNTAMVTVPEVQSMAYKIFMLKKVGINPQSARRPSDFYENMLNAMMMPLNDTLADRTERATVAFDALVPDTGNSNVLLTSSAVTALNSIIQNNKEKDDSAYEDSQGIAFTEQSVYTMFQVISQQAYNGINASVKNATDVYKRLAANSPPIRKGLLASHYLGLNGSTSGGGVFKHVLKKNPNKQVSDFVMSIVNAFDILLKQLTVLALSTAGVAVFPYSVDLTFRTVKPIRGTLSEYMMSLYKGSAPKQFSLTPVVDVPVGRILREAELAALAITERHMTMVLTNTGATYGNNSPSEIASGIMHLIFDKILSEIFNIEIYNADDVLNFNESTAKKIIVSGALQLKKKEMEEEGKKKGKVDDGPNKKGGDTADEVSVPTDKGPLGMAPPDLVGLREATDKVAKSVRTSDVAVKLLHGNIASTDGPTDEKFSVAVLHDEDAEAKRAEANKLSEAEAKKMAEKSRSDLVKNPADYSNMINWQYLGGDTDTIHSMMKDSYTNALTVQANTHKETPLVLNSSNFDDWAVKIRCAKGVSIDAMLALTKSKTIKDISIYPTVALIIKALQDNVSGEGVEGADAGESPKDMFAHLRIYDYHNARSLDIVNAPKRISTLSAFKTYLPVGKENGGPIFPTMTEMQSKVIEGLVMASSAKKASSSETKTLLSTLTDIYSSINYTLVPLLNKPVHADKRLERNSSGGYKHKVVSKGYIAPEVMAQPIYNHYAPPLSNIFFGPDIVSATTKVSGGINSKYLFVVRPILPAINSQDLPPKVYTMDIASGQATLIEETDSNLSGAGDAAASIDVESPEDVAFELNNIIQRDMSHVVSRKLKSLINEPEVKQSVVDPDEEGVNKMLSSTKDLELYLNTDLVGNSEEPVSQAIITLTLNTNEKPKTEYKDVTTTTETFDNHDIYRKFKQSFRKANLDVNWVTRSFAPASEAPLIKDALLSTQDYDPDADKDAPSSSLVVETVLALKEVTTRTITTDEEGKSVHAVSGGAIHTKIAINVTAPSKDVLTSILHPADGLFDTVVKPHIAASISYGSLVTVSTNTVMRIISNIVTGYLRILILSAVNKVFDTYRQQLRKGKSDAELIKNMTEFTMLFKNMLASNSTKFHVKMIAKKGFPVSAKIVSVSMEAKGSMQRRIRTSFTGYVLGQSGAPSVIINNAWNIIEYYTTTMSAAAINHVKDNSKDMYGEMNTYGMLSITKFTRKVGGTATPGNLYEYVPVSPELAKMLKKKDIVAPATVNTFDITSVNKKTIMGTLANLIFDPKLLFPVKKAPWSKLGSFTLNATSAYPVWGESLSGDNAVSSPTASFTSNGNITSLMDSLAGCLLGCARISASEKLHHGIGLNRRATLMSKPDNNKAIVQTVLQAALVKGVSVFNDVIGSSVGKYIQFLQGTIIAATHVEVYRPDIKSPPPVTQTTATNSGKSTAYKLTKLYPWFLQGTSSLGDAITLRNPATDTFKPRHYLGPRKDDTLHVGLDLILTQGIKGKPLGKLYDSKEALEIQQKVWADPTVKSKGSDIPVAVAPYEGYVCYSLNNGYGITCRYVPKDRRVESNSIPVFLLGHNDPTSFLYAGPANDTRLQVYMQGIFKQKLPDAAIKKLKRISDADITDYTIYNSAVKGHAKENFVRIKDAYKKDTYAYFFYVYINYFHDLYTESARLTIKAATNIVKGVINDDLAKIQMRVAEGDVLCVYGHSGSSRTNYHYDDGHAAHIHFLPYRIHKDGPVCRKSGRLRKIVERSSSSLSSAEASTLLISGVNGMLKSVHPYLKKEKDLRRLTYNPDLFLYNIDEISTVYQFSRSSDVGAASDEDVRGELNATADPGTIQLKHLYEKSDWRRYIDFEAMNIMLEEQYSIDLPSVSMRYCDVDVAANLPAAYITYDDIYLAGIRSTAVSVRGNGSHVGTTVSFTRGMSVRALWLVIRARIEQGVRAELKISKQSGIFSLAYLHAMGKSSSDIANAVSKAVTATLASPYIQPALSGISLTVANHSVIKKEYEDTFGKSEFVFDWTEYVTFLDLSGPHYLKDIPELLVSSDNVEDALTLAVDIILNPGNNGRVLDKQDPYFRIEARSIMAGEEGLLQGELDQLLTTRAWANDRYLTFDKFINELKMYSDKTVVFSKDPGKVLDITTRGHARTTLVQSAFERVSLITDRSMTYYDWSTSFGDEDKSKEE